LESMRKSLQQKRVTNGPGCQDSIPSGRPLRWRGNPRVVAWLLEHWSAPAKSLLETLPIYHHRSRFGVQCLMVRFFGRCLLAASRISSNVNRQGPCLGVGRRDPGIWKRVHTWKLDSRENCFVAHEVQGTQSRFLQAAESHAPSADMQQLGYIDVSFLLHSANSWCHATRVKSPNLLVSKQFARNRVSKTSLTKLPRVVILRTRHVAGRASVRVQLQASQPKSQTRRLVSMPGYWNPDGGSALRWCRRSPKGTLASVLRVLAISPSRAQGQRDCVIDRRVVLSPPSSVALMITLWSGSESITCWPQRTCLGHRSEPSFERVERLPQSGASIITAISTRRP